MLLNCMFHCRRPEILPGKLNLGAELGNQIRYKPSEYVLELLLHLC